MASNRGKILKLTGFIVLLVAADYAVQNYLPTYLTEVLRVNDAVWSVALWRGWLSGARS